MPAGKDPKGDPIFLLDPNHLHIWPRHSFMLIALPNKVRSNIYYRRARSTEGADVSQLFFSRTSLSLAPSLHLPPILHSSLNRHEH